MDDDEQRVTEMFIAPLTGVHACDSANIQWHYTGTPNEDDSAIIRIWAASDNSDNYANLTRQSQTVSHTAGTDLRYWTWPRVSVPPGMYRFLITDEDSGVNATSTLFEILPLKQGVSKSCYSSTDITDPIPGPNTGSGSQPVVSNNPASHTADAPKPKAQTIVPSVIVPVVVVITVLVLGLCFWRRNRRSAAQSRRWDAFQSFLSRHGIGGGRGGAGGGGGGLYHDNPYSSAAGGPFGAGPEKRRRRKKDKLSVALPSAPVSAAARQTSARQLNESDLGPYGFVSRETDAYPMHDRGSTHRRAGGGAGARPSSFRSSTAGSLHSGTGPNERGLKDFMLYDSNESDGAYGDSDDDGMDDDEDFKVVHGTGFYDANRGSLVSSGGGGSRGSKMLVVPPAGNERGSGRNSPAGSRLSPLLDEADPLLRHGDGSERLAQSRPRSTRRGEPRGSSLGSGGPLLPPSTLRDEEEMGILSSSSTKYSHGRDSSASYAQSPTASDEYASPRGGSQAHLFTSLPPRRGGGYGDSEGYGDVPPNLLPTSQFSLRPPTSAVTRQHHHEARLDEAPSAAPASRPRSSQRARRHTGLTY